MTYYADFSLYDFIEYEEPEGLTIGWLEDGFDYNIDEVSEEDLADIIDLGSLRQRRSQGWHSCTLCQEYTEHSVTSARANVDYRLGHAEIRAVSDDGALYVAPNLIIHYIVDHLYGPPVEFIDAVRSEVRRRWPDGKWRSATGGGSAAAPRDLPSETHAVSRRHGNRGDAEVLRSDDVARDLRQRLTPGRTAT